MSHPNGTVVQPNPSELFERYLRRQAEAQAAGLATTEATGEVLPYDAGPVQPIDAKLAWDESIAVARLLNPAVNSKAWQAPPHWQSLVAVHEPAAALAFAFGNFPQLVRNLQLLLQKPDLTALRPEAGQPASVPALTDWAEQVFAKRQFPQMLLAVGALRLAKQFDLAAKLIALPESAVPAEWRAAWANEQAALAWHAGRHAEARAMWQKLPDSPPVLFNRGMASLFLGDAAEARAALDQAVAQLPEASAWHHLGRLYLTLTETRA